MLSQKLLIALIGMIIPAHFACAQVKEKPVFISIYSEIGWSLSSYYSSDKILEPGFSSFSGINIGVGTNLRFLQRDKRSKVRDGLLAVKTGLHYIDAGFRINETKVVAGYLSIPIYFQYYPIKDLFVELGSDIFMNVGLSPSSVIIQGLLFDLDKHKAHDFKVGFGIGYTHKFDKIGPIGISVKYLIGTSDFAENLPWKNNNFQISLIWLFGVS